MHRLSYKIMVNGLCLTCRVLVRRARKLAQQYFLVYQEPIPTGQLVQRVASVMQEYTQSGWVFTDMLQMPTSPLFVDFMDKMSSVRVLIWNLSCCLLQWSASIWSVVADSWVGWRPSLPVPVRPLCMFFFLFIFILSTIQLLKALIYIYILVFDYHVELYTLHLLFQIKCLHICKMSGIHFIIIFWINSCRNVEIISKAKLCKRFFLLLIGCIFCMESHSNGKELR